MFARLRELLKRIKSSDRPLGWVTPAVCVVTWYLSRLGEVFYGSRDDAQELAEAGTEHEMHDCRTKAVDIYVIACVVVEFIAYLAISFKYCPQTWIKATLLGVMGLRAFSIVGVALQFGLFARIVNRPGVKPRVASKERIVVLGFVNYFELVLCSAAFYASAPHLISKSCKVDLWDPLYLSVAAQLTIGFGDVSPKGWLRLVTCIQGAMSFILITLLIGRFASLLHAIDELNSKNDDASVANIPQRGSGE